MENETLIRIDERLKDVANDVSEIKQRLFGNGREGLCYVVDRHETYFKAYNKALIIFGTALVGVLAKMFFVG